MFFGADDSFYKLLRDLSQLLLLQLILDMLLVGVASRHIFAFTESNIELFMILEALLRIVSKAIVGVNGRGVLLERGGDLWIALQVQIRPLLAGRLINDGSFHFQRGLGDADEALCELFSHLLVIFTVEVQPLMIQQILGLNPQVRFLLETLFEKVLTYFRDIFGDRGGRVLVC